MEEGYPQREIANSAYDFQRRVEAQDEIIVGVNRYRQEHRGSEIPTLAIDPRVEADQVARVRAIRARRNPQAAEAARAAVRDACTNGDNLMPRLLQAGRDDCTVGELCNVFREVFGEYRDPGGF